MACNKLVSVCINAYNSEKYIAETLKSVCAQTYQNLQIIVVDDASSDNTANIVKGFGDARIELYTLEKNGHISNANNETYRRVRGEYMTHIDSDDVMLPDLIEKSVAFLEENPQYGATFAKPISVDENGNVIEVENFDSVFDIDAKTQADFVRLFFDSLNRLLHPGVTMRKSVIDEIGFHDLSLCYLHDFDYWTRLVLKFPIKVLDGKLIRYRINTANEHNSCLSEGKRNAHDIEFARIIYNMIANCPDDMFLQAFEDRLRFKGYHTHKETALEKAFLLQEGLKATLLPQNKILSITMLSQLFQDEEYVKIARDKFDFTVRDFYELQTNETLHHQLRFDTRQHELNLQILEREKKIANLQSEINDVNLALQKKQIEFANVVNLCDSRLAEIERLNSILHHKQKILNKFIIYRIAKIVKKCFKALKRAKHFLDLRDKNGKKYRKSVMLYGFYGVNLGDDLFFEKIVSRYPDTMFFVYYNQHYRAFFEKFDNVKFYACEDPLVCKIVGFGNKLKIYDLFELLLLKRSSATVHIGGSIYQQIGDYDLDYKLRYRRKRPFKPFYSISCNFGAYKTEAFKEKWGKQFKRFKDICFRDKYSFNLFSNLKSVRYAPDLLFSYKHDGNVATIPNSVAISVFNPFAEFRKMPQNVGENYLNTLKKTVCDLVDSGKKVNLLAFCASEGDVDFIAKLLGELPQDIAKAVNVINYDFNTKDQVLDALASAEFIIGTRLHSVILGLGMGKKVLPIVYNSKIKYILEDIEYNQPIIEIDKLDDYAKTGLASLLDGLEIFDASQYTNSDDLQFKKLDKFLK